MITHEIWGGQRWTSPKTSPPLLSEICRHHLGHKKLIDIPTTTTLHTRYDLVWMVSRSPMDFALYPTVEFQFSYLEMPTLAPKPKSQLWAWQRSLLKFEFANTLHWINTSDETGHPIAKLRYLHRVASPHLCSLTTEWIHIYEWSRGTGATTTAKVGDLHSLETWRGTRDRVQVLGWFVAESLPAHLYGNWLRFHHGRSMYYSPLHCSTENKCVFPICLWNIWNFLPKAAVIRTKARQTLCDKMWSCPIEYSFVSGHIRLHITCWAQQPPRQKMANRPQPD